jgi:hypothetical protein
MSGTIPMRCAASRGIVDTKPGEQRANTAGSNGVTLVRTRGLAADHLFCGDVRNAMTVNSGVALGRSTRSRRATVVIRATVRAGPAPGKTT